jgi:hypothetical protein
VKKEERQSKDSFIDMVHVHYRNWLGKCFSKKIKNKSVRLRGL